MNNNFSHYSFTPVSESSKQEVLKSTYLLLALSMVPTAIGGIIGINMSFLMFATSPIMSSLIMMGAMYFLMFMVQKNRYSFYGVVWMMVFSLAMGVLLGPLLQFALRIPNGNQLIVLAALMTSAIFFVMSAVSTVLKREMPFLNNFLAVGSIVLLIAIVANIFLAIPMFHLIICGAFVIFSSLMILWQLNQIVTGGETNYISATLSLYISLYNLFTSLLQILIAFSGNDRR